MSEQGQQVRGKYKISLAGHKACLVVPGRRLQHPNQPRVQLPTDETAVPQVHSRIEPIPPQISLAVPPQGPDHQPRRQRHPISPIPAKIPLSPRLAPSAKIPRLEPANPTQQSRLGLQTVQPMPETTLVPLKPAGIPVHPAEPMRVLSATRAIRQYHLHLYSDSGAGQWGQGQGHGLWGQAGRAGSGGAD